MIFLREDIRSIFDLQKTYDMLNKKYFKNELKKYPLAWMRSSKTLGVCEAKVVVQGKEIIRLSKIERIKISNFYELTYEQFEAIMAHEMIHALLLQRGILNDYGGTHGLEFTKEMDKLRKMGIPVTKTEDPMELAVSSHVKGKTVYGITFVSGTTSLVQFFSKESEAEKAAEYYKSRRYKDIQTFVTNNPKVSSSFRIFKSFDVARRSGSYRVTPEVDKLITGK